MHTRAEWMRVARQAAPQSPRGCIVEDHYNKNTTVDELGWRVTNWRQSVPLIILV